MDRLIFVGHFRGQYVIVKMGPPKKVEGHVTGILKHDFKAWGLGDAWTFMTIPFDVRVVYKTRSRVPVAGTINDFAFRNSIMPEGDGALATRAWYCAGDKPGIVCRSAIMSQIKVSGCVLPYP